MTKRAQLANGQVLEFPDDTSDAVMDAAVRAQLNPPAAQSPPAPLGVLGAIKGAADVALAGVNGVGQQLMGTAMGLGGAIHQAGAAMGVPGAYPNSSFIKGRDAYMESANRDERLIPAARLRTPEGERVSQFINGLPIGRVAGTTMHVSDIGRAIDNVGQGIENVAGPEARDIAGSALTLATMKGGAPGAAGVTADAVNAAKRAGYVVPPTIVLGNDVSLTEHALAAAGGRPAVGSPQFSSSTLERGARTWGGAPEVDARIAMRNQQVTQQLAAESARLPEMTPAAVQRSAAAANGVYDTIKSLTGPNGTPLHVPLNSQNFFNRVLNLAKTPGWQSMARLPDAVENLRHDLLTVHPTVEGVVNRVRQLRDDSFKNFDGDAEAQMLGRAQRDAADILEDELRDRLQSIGQTATNPNLRSIATRIFNEYTEARAQLSRLHNLRNTMNATTGTIDASKVSRLKAQGYNIEPQMDAIASAHDAFGGTGMQTVEKAAKVGGNVSPLDFGSGAIVGANMGALAGGGKGSLIGAAIGGLAIPFSRYAAQEFALRSPATRAVTGGVNNFLVKPGARAGVANSLIGEEPQ